MVPVLHYLSLWQLWTELSPLRISLSQKEVVGWNVSDLIHE